MRYILSVLLLTSTMCGLEIDPPVVPNPWNASETRALVDHLAETYQQTHDLKTPLAKLQQAYRQAWNARQAELFVQGDTSVDPRWLTARTAHDRMLLVDRVKELGGTPAPDATPEQLSAQVTQLLDKQRATLKAEADAKLKAEADARESAAEQARLSAERKQTAAQTAARGGQNGQSIRLRPMVQSNELPDEKAIAEKIIRFKWTPMLTQRESESIRDKALEQARMTIRRRSEGKLIGISGDGLEAWQALDVSTFDAEKTQIKVFLINLSEKTYCVEGYRLRFADSRRNKDIDNTQAKTGMVLATLRRGEDWNHMCFDGLNRLNLFFYVDPGQQISIDLDVSVRNDGPK